MNGNAYLYWFPIALAVGLAAALLGGRRAAPVTVLGVSCWVALRFLTDPRGAFGTSGDLAGLLLGAGILVGLAWWLGSRPVPDPEPHQPASTRATTAEEIDQAWASLIDAVCGFNDWLTANRNRPDPWPDFGEFVRSTLYLACQAKHICAYRLLTTDEEQLYPLRQTEPEEHDFPSARVGIIGHVITSGKSYYAGDPAQGALVEELAANGASGARSSAWCFAIKQNRQAIGVVRVGQIGAAALADRSRLRMTEGVIALCWTALTEACRSRVAGHTDPISGVLTYRAFTETAERSLDSAYEHGEPVALANISIEGLRTLADNGQWDLANQVLFKVSSLLQRRIRQDDEIGVFDGSRFLLLLRRVDSELASLIVQQLMDKLTVICEDQDRWRGILSVRCGLAGSGVSQPTLRTLISRATANCHEARQRSIALVSDLSPAPEAQHG